MLFANIKEIKQNEFLYKSGDAGDQFWFLMVGKLEVLVKTDDEFKYSKGIDES